LQCLLLPPPLLLLLLALTESVSSCVWMFGLSRQRRIARYTLSQLPLQRHHR
jgi:hypothetical protein